MSEFNRELLTKTTEAVENWTGWGTLPGQHMGSALIQVVLPELVRGAANQMLELEYLKSERDTLVAAVEDLRDELRHEAVDE